MIQMLHRYPIRVMYFRSIIIGLIVALFIMPVNAFDRVQSTVVVSGDPSVFYIDGVIDKDLWFNFYDRVKLGKIRTVELNSVGGYVIYAEEIAKLIRERRITTKVRNGAICLSACVLIFQSGIRRIAHKTAVFMIHSVKIEHDGFLVSDTWSTNRFFGWLMRYGMTIEATRALRTGRDMYFNSDSGIGYGVVTEIEK